jgi:Leucine-rich repeat (LRR) protein
MSKLTQEILNTSLSHLSKTGNGLNHAFARLECNEKELNDISILTNFPHLRYVILRSNEISDISPLDASTNLLSIDASSNKIENCTFVLRFLPRIGPNDADGWRNSEVGTP